jgi:molecular chaperone GrpE
MSSKQNNNKWEELASKSLDEEQEQSPIDDVQNAEKDDQAQAPEMLATDDALDDEKRLHASEEKLLTLESSLQQEKDKVLELMAEIANVRRRAARDVEKAHKFGVEKLLKELLPVVDSLEQALEAEKTSVSESVSAIQEGTELTLSLFLSALDKFSLKQINPVGETFDPLKHEAISMQANQEVAANTVLFVVQKGYSLNERVIRAAKVVVSKA